MIFRARQGREKHELHHVHGQLTFDDLDVAQDRFGRIVGKAENVARQRDDARLLGGEKKGAIFGDFVLPLLHRDQRVGIDVFQPDEHVEHVGAAALLDEVRDPMALRVDLDGQPDRLESVDLAQMDDPVEDCLPVLVAGEIVVSDKEADDALGDVAANDLLYVVRRAAARFSCPER